MWCLPIQKSTISTRQLWCDFCCQSHLLQNLHHYTFDSRFKRWVHPSSVYCSANTGPKQPSLSCFSHRRCRECLFSVSENWICLPGYNHIFSSVLMMRGTACCRYGILSQATSMEMLYLSKVPALLQHGFLVAQTAIADVTADGSSRTAALGRVCE